MVNSDKIPKIIHCCWLSGDPLPSLYQQCVDSWKRHMPDYEIMIWDMKRFPVDSVLFVKQACEAKKWAYATDYIRLYALYNHGGIYLDMDVMVYRRFDPFLGHSAFSSVEFNPRSFYEYFTKKPLLEIGIGIEAAVIGAEKGHPWIKDILEFYRDREFKNDPKYYWSIIMPRVITKISMEKYGFRLIPIYQVLENDIHLYPPDVFSSCYDLSVARLPDGKTIEDLGEYNKIRYSFHVCAHSWFEGVNVNSLNYKIKNLLIRIFGKNATTKAKKIFSKKSRINV